MLSQNLDTLSQIVSNCFYETKKHIFFSLFIFSYKWHDVNKISYNLQIVDILNSYLQWNTPLTD